MPIWLERLPYNPTKEANWKSNKNKTAGQKPARKVAEREVAHCHVKCDSGGEQTPDIRPNLAQ